MTTSQFFNMIMIAIIFMLPISAIAQPYRNVTSGASLVADEASSVWPSPSGEFAFGFQQVPPGGYLLAIWLDKIQEKTIVWSANRNNLSPQGSRIQLLSDGRFELTDPTGRVIWSASLNGSTGVAYGAMLDSGEFVLAANTSAFLWRSSDVPTDTLLPGQILGQNSDLVSSYSATNYSNGRFTLIMQNDGNLVLYTRNYPMDNTIGAYWSTMSVGSGFQLNFNLSGYIYLSARNGTVITLLSSNGASTSHFYQRFTLEYDGVLRHYVYPKSATGGRSMAWSVNSFLPSNICTDVRQSTGGGACGFNSLCELGTDQRPRCSCPIGYSPIDPQDWMSGCKQDFVQQSCDKAKPEDDLFTFIDMPDTDWPDSDYAHFIPVNEEQCRQTCLSDCLCAVAIYRDTNCWKKKVPLSNGKIDSSVGGKALIKIRRNNSIDDDPFARNSRNRSRSTLIIILSTLLGSSVFVNLLLLSSVVLFVYRFNGGRMKWNRATTAAVHPGVNIRSFSFNELQVATNGFKEELGSGACSTVYKGTLKDEDGRVVAVKKLVKLTGSGVDQEFRAEVSSISRTNHKNLVQLLGYCDEGQNKLLVYEFMKNGSLADFLFDTSSRPNWYRRVQIAFAIARGLCYLHEECSTQIIHCDIKPQNILLDEAHQPKISDFGLAKLLRPDQTRTTTGIRGTRGYVAPEWFRNLPITTKVDVYSFGILLLELLCCRKNYVEVEDEREAVLVDWAYDCYKEGTLHQLVANDEEAIDDMARFDKFAGVAIWCTQEDPALRPHMKSDPYA